MKKGAEDEVEKDRIIDLMIHDLVGPLAVVSTSAANLLQKAARYGPLTDAQRVSLERILRNSRKAQSILHEMIEVSKSEEGLFKKESFLVEGTFRESVIEALETTLPESSEEPCPHRDAEAFRCFLENRGIHVEIAGRFCRAPFCHDERKIRQILRNLISNALKYRRKRLDICINGEKDLIVSVKDDGKGISAGEQELLFKRFSRLEGEGEGGMPGLGLGLAGVKALVKAMGGEISLVSQEGEGTCLTVRIPSLR